MLAIRTLTATLALCAVSTFATAQEGPPDVEARVEVLDGTGINPLCLMGERPMIGTLWNAGIDGTAVPGTRAAILVVSPALIPNGFLTDFGEMLIDPYQRLITLTRVIQDGKATFGIPIPEDLSLLGQTFYAQALAHGQRQMILCNGLELQLGSPMRAGDR